MLDASAARARLQEIHAVLAPLREVWAPAPFRAIPAPWEAAHPQLAAWARARSAEEIDLLEDDLVRLQARPDLPAPLGDWIRACAALSDLPAWPHPPQQAPPQLSMSVRKSAQIDRFLGVVLPRLPSGEPLLDWCAGKGHLGRALSLRSGRRVRALERDAELCRSGAALAEEQPGASLQFVTGDALCPEGQAALDGAAGALALHACGGLTDALIEAAVAHDTPWLALAPCCYWRVICERYSPRSAAAKGADLDLDRALLRLACNEERTGSPRSRAERRRHMAWRLALSLLQQEATGGAEPEPLPDGVRELLTLPFAEFCARAAAELGVPLPARWDADRALDRGWERARLVRGLGLVRAPFRRPLELWLALDRACRLAERGYALQIGTFCAPEQSPRNLLLLARR